MRHCGSCQIKHRVDIYLECQLPFRVADVADVFEGRLVGSVVYQNVYAAQFVYCRLDDGSAMVSLLKVARDHDRLATFLFNEILDLLGIFIFAQIRDQHIGALSSISDRDRASDAAVAAGDDRFHAVQSA